ncbi:MAG: signal peptidase I [Defluviitaleaceae bacterium]|nr:signal peptidase I [Defluviitaleaceae bacterium]
MFKNQIANPFVRNLLEWFVAIGLAVLFIFVTRNFLFRMAHVDGNSMEPTLSNGNIVVLNRLGWLVSGPRVNDIVAFPYRMDPSENFIKRVIGLPGDTVDIVDGAFYVNGVLLEDAFTHERIADRWDTNFPVTIPEGTVFVLGDNRNGSKDSRFSSVGNVPISEIVGRVSVRVWPIGGLGRP